MSDFLICVHDASPAWERETRDILRDLAPLVGRRIAIGVVPDWHGEWPLARHADYCGLVREHSEERLLHGYHHRRRRGWSPITALARGSDEMSGMSFDETVDAVGRGRRVLEEAFGERVEGFLPPAWQRGHVASPYVRALELEFVLGYFSIESSTGHRLPLATWSWDCGRWAWLGHAGQGIGSLLHAVGQRVPTVAIHPADLRRGFWPTILRRVRRLLADGYRASTPSDLLRSRNAEIAL